MKDLRRLWEPRAVAVIGASGREGAMGQAPVRFLRQHGYEGDVYPINPNYDEILGYPCYPSVVDCPGPVDLALVMVGADKVPGALEDCAAKGVGFAVVLASGFAEAGEEGARLQREMIQLAEERRLTLIGPNCIGLVNPYVKLVAGFSPLFVKGHFEPGEIGLVTQSGALGYGIVSLGLEQGLHFSRVISTGNEAVFTSYEAVRDLLLDDVTEVILGYSEELKRAPEWPELACLALERGKPIILLKVGRTAAGARAAASHTASLSGDDAAYDAAFRQLGILRADDVDELLYLASAFRQKRYPRGKRIGVLTTSGGAGIMAADACTQLGFDVPELTPETRKVLDQYVPPYGATANPVDVTATVIADREVFGRCLRQMAGDPVLDVMLTCFTVLTGASAEQLVEDVLALKEATEKPVLLSKTGADFLAPDARSKLLAGKVPVFATPAQAVRAVEALWRFALARGRAEAVAAVAKAAATRGAELPAGFPSPGAALTERAAKALLARHGLPVTRETLAASANEAVEAAERIGYPVVLKIESPDILHKTEAGGVIVGVRNAAEVRDAHDRILAAARAHHPSARLSGVLVQEQVEGGMEMLVGISPSVFGPMLTVAAGGVLVEVLRDSAMRLVPLDRSEAEAMVMSLNMAPLLQGVRGRQPADVAALIEVILKISAFAADSPGAWQLDLNPVVILPQGRGVRIVDALLVGGA